MIPASMFDRTFWNKNPIINPPIPSKASKAKILYTLKGLMDDRVWISCLLCAKEEVILLLNRIITK